MIKLAASAVAAAAVGAALVSTPSAEPVAAEQRAARAQGLQAFGSCAALVRYSNRHARQEFGSWGRAGLPAMGVAQEDSAAGGADRAEPSFSTTNLQEAGVDEPDIVKTDGSTVFAIARGKLHAVDVSGEAPRLLSSVELGDSWDHQMLIHDGKALIAWSSWRESDYQDVTVLAEVDVRDPAAMRLVKTVTVDGLFVSARMTGATARVVTRSTPRAVTLPATARRRGRASQWLPSMEVRDRRTPRALVERRPAVGCDDVSHSPTFSGLEMMTVLTIDIDQGVEPIDTDSVMTGADTVYASTTGLYVATARWLRPDRQDLPDRFRSTIHRFDTSDPQSTTYRGSGSVPGHLLNQFSMSEHEGVLRVASSDTPEWWFGPEMGEERESESFVTTLRPDPATGALDEVGSVGGLGRGERIYAVRFFGTVGYVVTFRETDPLYTLDLSDPAAPAVLGELKIRGYSAYLHPAGDGLLLGIGQDATERGQRLGSQVSLFDVSDLRRPRRLAHHALGDGFSSSEVEYDHHAFLWWPATGLAVVPVTAWDERDAGVTSAAVGLRVGPNGISEVGRADHPGNSYEAIVRRSLVVGDTLYTLSDRGLLASSLDALARRSWLPFG